MFSLRQHQVKTVHGFNWRIKPAALECPANVCCSHSNSTTFWQSGDPQVKPLKCFHWRSITRCNLNPGNQAKTHTDAHRHIHTKSIIWFFCLKPWPLTSACCVAVICEWVSVVMRVRLASPLASWCEESCFLGLTVLQLTHLPLCHGCIWTSVPPTYDRSTLCF